ncbi:DUF3618 domain-containing protein [Actinomadura syzygii]|uniref:DUF3618 domain-containing protein n=1 Tax=Actinomadura syzygii TaxID=1427538 RepID=A0A5D0UJI4_9ACTN|nr:DUF3618 domain-containing protein [Actinomadura syzygii]TYC17299.1 DUF3618 domain-containing protein [Actinomadura syzygii]
MADRSRDPEELEREIERTRRELARTIDELADRVNPKNVAHRGAERLKEEAGQVAKAARALVRPAEGAVDDYDDGGADGGIDKRLLLVGVGAAVTVTALVLWGRRRRRR